MKILVTGGSGFIGRAAVERFSLEESNEVVATVRRNPSTPIAGVNYVEVPDLGAERELERAIAGVDAILHTAARVHVTSASASAQECEFRRVNVCGTRNLARHAVNAGVKRFVFMSSIKVNGASTERGKPFSPHDKPAPTDAYGRSKLEAERALQELSQAGDMAVVVIRPPLVYGPGVRANFLAMMRWIHSGWPVPLGRVNNRRSFVARDNLVDLIATCAVHPAAANQTFTVSDDEDVSTSELVRRIGAALQKPARLVPLPVGLVRVCASLAGRHRQAERLLDSLEVDISKTRSVLGWSPVTGMQAALNDTARHFLETMRQ